MDVENTDIFVKWVILTSLKKSREMNTEAIQETVVRTW